MTTQRERIPRNGLTIRELAERTGFTPRTIQNWTSEPREVFLARADAKRVAVLRLHAEGKSMRTIAREIGCSVGTVHRYVHGA